MVASSVENLMTNLGNYINSGDIPKEMIDRMNKAAANAANDFTKEASEFIKYDMDDSKHTSDQLKAIIDAFPESLSLYEYGGFPMHDVVDNSTAISFLPLLAEEGCRLNVGGEGMRGGLIPRSDGDINILQRLVWGESIKEEGEKSLKVLEKLRELGLFKKEDIKNFDLLFESLDGAMITPQMFEMLVNWDPDALKKHDMSSGRSLLNDANHSKDTFEIVLKAGMEHFPDEFGLLFRKFRGKTACETAFDNFGANEVMPIICRWITPSEDNLIIHAVAEVAPHLENIMTNYYRDAVFARDRSGRTLSQVKFHAALRRGSQSFKANASFYTNATDSQIESRDPLSGLYPFMMLASGDCSDLDAVNYLLRRCPEMLTSNTNTVKHGVGVSQRGCRKRQRDTS